MIKTHTDYEYSIKPIRPNTLECILIDKETNIRYGMVCQTNGMPPNEWVFQQFQQNPKGFFVDVDEIKEAVVPVVETPITGSAS